MGDGLWALLGVLVGGGISAAIAWRSTQAAADQLREQLAHERQLAAETRNQARIEVVYLHLLSYLNDAQRLIETDSPSKPEPDYSSMQRQMDSLWPELDAFGSPEVRSLFDGWRGPWLLFQVEISNARLRQPSGGSDPVELAELNRNRSDSLTAAKRIQEMVSSELRGEGRAQLGSTG